MNHRRGFTLLELLVALVLALSVGAVVQRLLAGGFRLTREQFERGALQDNARTVAAVVAGELGGLANEDVSPEAAAATGLPAGTVSDLLALAPGAVTYRAVRGVGLACAAGLAPAEVRLASSSWRAARAPRPTDSLLVYLEGDPAIAADDVWLHLGVSGVTMGSCPDGSDALLVRVSAAPPVDLAVLLSRLVPGAPARLTEVMEMRYYRSDAASWFGMRSVSTGEAITPVAGPLADSSGTVRGLTLTYRNTAGQVTTDPAAVTEVEVRVVGVTDAPVRVDTFALVGRVALRNAVLR